VLPTAIRRPRVTAGDVTDARKVWGVRDGVGQVTMGFRSPQAALGGSPFRAHFSELWPAHPRVDSFSMSDVTRLIDAAAAGDRKAAADLLPLVYDELRKLAAARLAREKPGQTLQATALVHEAYLRLVGSDPAQQWNGRGHFFAAAAEAMRRILVEGVRRKGRDKHGGEQRRADVDLDALVQDGPDEELLALHEALNQFAAHDPVKAKLVELRFFGGLTLEQAAECLNISLSTADRSWRYARAWIHTAMAGDSPGKKEPT
jgi:RNA polymerase sigma factor (TIGR02999 family)